MTHTEVIGHLLALGESRPRGAQDGPPLWSAATREAVTAHVARCSDCWRTLADLHAAASDEAPAETADVAARFGCETVRDELYLLVALDPASIAREHAPAARHLGWCHACRSRLAELVAVEQEYATAPRWVVAGERVREAVGRLVVRIGRAASGLVEIPEAFVLVPAPATVPVRGAAAPAVPQAARVQVGDRDLWAEIAVDGAGAADTGLALRLSSAVAEPLSVRLCEARADGDALVARYTLRGTEPARVRGLWPGAFVVELHDPRDARVHRIRLDIAAGT